MTTNVKYVKGFGDGDGVVDLKVGSNGVENILNEGSPGVSTVLMKFDCTHQGFLHNSIIH